MPHYVIRYLEGARPSSGQPDTRRRGAQLIGARDDAEAAAIAADVCRPGRYNGQMARVVQVTERV